MFPHSKSVTPAVQSYFDAQASLFNDLSRSMTNSIQNVFQANLQLGQSVLEEAVLAAARLMTAGDSSTVLGNAAGHAQPAADKLRAYQQHLSRIAANTQAELTRVVEQHVPETSRTANALADQVQQATSEQTERSLRQQEQALKNFHDPFKSNGIQSTDGQSHPDGAGSTSIDRAGASMQSSNPRQGGGKSPETPS